MGSIYNYTQEELKEKFAARSFPAYTAGQVFSWIYDKKAKDFEAMSNLSKEMREFLEGNFDTARLVLLKTELSSDKTQKFLFKLKDQATIESVLIPEKTRNTICISTQVGCKFRCSFCLSGKSGFRRNLEVSEIINQYLSILDLIRPKLITNIVFMGIGEPLDNFTNTVKAINILGDKKGANFSKSRITISTCGLVPQIKQLAELNLGVKLSISLHSADDEVRSKLMPINKKYPLKSLISAVKTFAKVSKYPITFEYTLIEGINSGRRDAQKLVRLLSGANAKVNLIPYNLAFSKFTSPSGDTLNNFTAELKKKGVFFTLRKPRGQDIQAACGQLRAEFLKDRGQR